MLLHGSANTSVPIHWTSILLSPAQRVSSKYVFVVLIAFLVANAIASELDAANVLLVTGGTTLSTQESYKKTGLENLGHTVTTIEDAATQSAFNTALASADVVYVNEDVDSVDLGYKLRETTVGVVSEELALDTEFGFASSDGYEQSMTAIEITNSSHAVTAGFSTGSVSVTSSNQPLIVIQGTFAPDGLTLATIYSAPCFMVIEAGGTLASTYNSSTVAFGHRVRLPWGGNAFNVTTLNSNGQTLTSQAVAWAATGKSLVAHWKFDEGTGTSIADSSGYGHAAAFDDGSPSWTTGIRNGAIQFDGLSDVETDADFDPPSICTVALWYRSGATPTSNERLLGATGNWEIRTDASGVIYCDLAGSDGGTFSTGSSAMSTGKWRHLVAMYNTVNDTYKLYIDGELDSSGAFTCSDEIAARLTIGSRTGSSERFNGAIDDVRIYNYELSSSEVGELYGLIGHWKLDEISGGTAADSSLVNNQGNYWNGATPGAAGPYPGKGEYAASLDGYDDLVGVYSHTAYDSTTEAISVAAWIQFDTAVSDQTVQQFPIMRQNWDDQTGFSLMTNQPYSDHLLFCVFNGTTYKDAVVSGDNFAANNWYHVVGTFNGETIKLYVDSKLVASEAFAATIEPAAEDITIGWAQAGKLFDVRLYNRAISQAEIAEIYGLVAHWQFEEGAGNTATDISGVGNDGAGVGTLAWNNIYRKEGTYSLDLDSSNYVRIQDETPIEPGDASLAGWARYSGSGDGELISLADFFAVRLNPSVVTAFMYNGSAHQSVTKSKTISGSWHHFAAVFNNGTQEMKLYIDGALEASMTTSGQMAVTPWYTSTTLGRHAGEGSYPYSGMMDDMRVYNRPISPDEVQSLYHSGKNGLRVIKWVETK